MAGRVLIDEAQLEECRNTLWQRSRARGRWLTLLFLRQLLIGLLLFFLILPLVAGHLPARADVTGRNLVVRLMGALVLALFSTGIAYRQVGQTLQLSVLEHRKRLEQDWAKWGGPQWLRHTLRTGLLVTLGVGIPIGLLVAATSPLSDLPAGSRPLTLPYFLGLTALWAFPFAFGLRWLTLWQYRRWGVLGERPGQ